MVTEWLWEFVSTFLTGLLALFPTWSLPAGIDVSATSMGLIVGRISGYFPIVTLALCCLAVLGYHVFSTALRVVIFVYNLIPFKAT